MSKFSVGDRVAFARDVVRRLGHDKPTADARGRVLAVHGRYTVDVERLADGRCFRVSGLNF